METKKAECEGASVKVDCSLRQRSGMEFPTMRSPEAGDMTISGDNEVKLKRLSCHSASTTTSKPLVRSPGLATSVHAAKDDWQEWQKQNENMQGKGFSDLS